MLIFQRIGTSLLFELPDVGTPGRSPGVVAYLFPSKVPAKETISAEDAWKIRAGLFLFLERLPSAGKLDDFAAAVWEEVGHVDHASFAWVPGDPDQTDSLEVQYLGLRPTSKGNGRIDGDSSTSLTFRQFRLFYADEVPVIAQDLKSDAPSFVFENDQRRGIQLQPSANSGGPVLTRTTLRLTGDELGYQLFDTRFDGDDIGAGNFDVACRYSIPSGGGGASSGESLGYPVFDLRGDAALDLAVRLSPTFFADS